MRKMSSLLCLLTLLTGFDGRALADEGAAAGSVEVENVIYGGSGCPQGSAEVTIAPDKKSFRIVFDQFVALAASGIPLSESRKACTVNVSAQVSEGFTWGVGRADFRGQARVARGGTGLHRNIYFFQGQAQQASSSHMFVSPFNGSWQHTDEFDATEALFAPCGLPRSLNITTSTRVTAGEGPTDGGFVVLRAMRVFQLLVKRCD